MSGSGSGSAAGTPFATFRGVAHDDIYTRANPSAAPVAGGATTPGSRFGGHSLQARTFRWMALIGRRMTGIAYRNLRRLEGWRTRQGQAGSPNRVAGGPSPHETSGRS